MGVGTRGLNGAGTRGLNGSWNKRVKWELGTGGVGLKWEVETGELNGRKQEG